METLACFRRRKRGREEHHAEFEDVAEAEGLVSPQSKRKRTASSAAASLKDMPFIDIIKHDCRLTSHAVKRLVEDYQSKKVSVTYEILTMLFEACGAKHEIYPECLREFKVDDIVVSLVDLARKGLVEDNYNSKHKDLKIFKENLTSFWDGLVLDCKNGPLFDDLLVQKIKDYVVSLSCAPPRVYRQVASLLGLELVTTFISVAKNQRGQHETIQRQLNTEMKKQGDGPLPESLNKRLTLMHAKITYLEELVLKIFSRHQLVSDDDLGPLYDLLIDEPPMIRHVIGELVCDHLIAQNIKTSHPGARAGKNKPSGVHIGRMLQILREFSDDPVLISYIIEDIWDVMKAMKGWRCMVPVLLDEIPAIELTGMDGANLDILENNRCEITSALWTRHPQLLRKFIYDKAKISPLVDMMKLELYSHKRQEKHFKTAIDLITDAFFKHGEKGPLRSCIKAITFCCTECQADLKDYAENKLMNLEDELVLKVRTAMKEIEAGADDYALLVNLKQLYELQLSKPVKNDSLFEDMYRILAHLRDIDNEVKSFLLINIYHQVAWCLHSIDGENPSETCIELLSKQNSLFDQLYYYLAVLLLPTYQKEGRSTTLLSCRARIITANMWWLFKKSKYSSTSLESLGYLPSTYMVQKFWELCEQQLHISDETEDEDANEEYIKDTNWGAIIIAAAKPVLADTVSKDYLAPEIVSHYVSHGASMTDTMKYLITSLKMKKNANFDMEALFFEALKRVVTMLIMMPLDYSSFKDSYGSWASYVPSALTKTQVFVKIMDRTLSFQIDTSKDIDFLKSEIEQRLRIDVSQCTFNCGLSTLESRVPLSIYGITTDAHIHMNPRLRGGFRSLGYFVEDHERDFIRTVRLPDRTEQIEFTELACLILSSLIHCFTSALVAGKTWDGRFDLNSFYILGYKVKAFSKPRKGLNSTKMLEDCKRFTEICRATFVVNNEYPPYFSHLLKKLDNLEVDVLSRDEQFAIDNHISLMPSLNRISVLHHIKRKYDGWSYIEKDRFRSLLDTCVLPLDWLYDLENVPIFREVIHRARTDGHSYCPTGTGAFLLSRNYTTHVTDYSWLEFYYAQHKYYYQWFECNNGVELMIPKHLKDFVADMVDMLIDGNFDVKEVIRACGVSVRASDLPSSDSSSSDSPGKRRGHTQTGSSQKRRKIWYP